MALTLPTMTYEWSPTTPGLAAPSYTSMEVGATDVTHCNIKRGRPNEFSRFEPGVCELTLFDPDRNFDPTWTGGTFGANVTLDKRIRVSATWAGTPYRVFTGFIESITPQWDSQTGPYVKIVAVDLLKPLLLKRIVGTAYHDAVIADGPFDYYRLGEKGTSFLENEARPLRPAAANNAILGVPGALPAETDTAIDFGQKTGHVVWPSTGNLAGTATFSLECWLQPRSVDPVGVDRYFHQGDGVSAATVICYINADYTVQLNIFDGTDGGWRTSSAAMLPYQWNHVVVSRAGATPTDWHTYINGVLADGTSGVIGTGNPSIVDLVAHLASDNGPTPRFDGAMDEFATYSPSLTGTQVAAHYAAAGGFRSTALTGSRITSVLNEIGVAAGDRSIDAGGFDVQPAPSPLWKQYALAYLEAVAASDGYPAVLFVSGDNKVVFQDRSHAVPASSGTFGEHDLPYEFPVEPRRADTDYWNEVVADAQNLPTQLATAVLSAGSIVRTQTIGGLVNSSATDLATIASDALARGNNPSPLRIPALQLHPLDDPTNLYPQVLGSELMDRKLVKRDVPLGGGAGMSADVRIQHIEHDISHETGDWHTTWQVAPT